MNNKKLALAVMAVLLVAGLIGTGIMAWFTSQKSIENNLFQAGTLVIELAGDTPAEALMEFENMQPGDVEEATAVIKNAGSLPFKFYAIISEDDSVLGNDDAGSEGGYLPDVLNVTVTMQGGQVYEGPLSALLNQVLVYADASGAPVTVAPGETADIDIKVVFNTAAGNEYQGASFTGTITFIATQVNNPAEWQSFAFEKDKETEVSFATQGVDMKVKAGEESNTVIKVERYDFDPVAPPAGLDPAGVYLNISANPPLPADSEVVLEVSYDPDALPAGINETDLKLFHFTGGNWVDITDTVDTVNKKIISKPISGFSTFGVFYKVLVYNEKTGLIYTTIQSAIEAANAGDTIIVNEGTFEESLTIDKEGLILKSAFGPESTVIDGGGAASSITITADNVTVEGFTVTGAADTGFDKGDILLIEVQDNTIKNNIITANAGNGICLLQSDNNIIKNNVITGNEYGIRFDNTGYPIGKSCNYNTVVGNNISDNRSRGVYFRASMNGAMGNSFLNNTITNNNSYGIQVEGFVFKRNTIEGNIISGHTTNGISINEGARENTIKNNTIFNNFGNTYSIFAGGIYIGGSSSYPSNNIIEGNIIYANYNGVSLYNAQENAIRDNIIRSNTNYGIYLDTANDNEIQGNNIFNNTKAGVLADRYFSTGNDATNNWWGHESGPKPVGQGDNVENVTYDPWATEPFDLSE